MELLINSFFQDVVAEFDRGSLYARLKRRELCDYLSSMIQNCSSVEGDTEGTCNKAVLAALHFHSRSKAGNGGVCLMGKYHNVLYIAARLAFVFRLENTETIFQLLMAIFHCEGTFERLLTGAIFGPRLCGAFSGWKSEFDSREECVLALRYLLDRAARGRMEFGGRRLADVPLLVAAHAVPATLALQVGRGDVFRLLVEYGAELHQPQDDLMTPMETLARLEEEVEPLRSDECLSLGTNLHLGGHGWPLPSLKQLARHSIRACLNRNFQLPRGACDLPLPGTLIRYIRLEEC